MDRGFPEQLCQSCESISLEDLVSPCGVTKVLQPGSCRLCDLLFQALESCECGEEWECRADLSGQPETLRRKPYAYRGRDSQSNYDIESERRQKRKSLSLRGKSTMNGGVKAELPIIRLPARLSALVTDTIKLWARPIDHARSMMAALKGGHAVDMKFKLEGITVCYGRADAMQKIAENWPSAVMSLEAGRNAVLSAVSVLIMRNPGAVYGSSAGHVCAGGLNFMANSGKLRLLLELFITGLI